MSERPTRSITGAAQASRSLFWSLVESGGLSILSLAVLMVVARLVGPAELGAFAIAYGILQILTMLVEMLVHDALIQRPRLSSRHSDTAFWTCVSLAGVLCGACWIVADDIADAFGAETVSPLVAVGSLGLLASAAGAIPVALLRRDMRFKPLAVRALVGRLCGALAAVALAAAQFGVWALLAQHLVQVTLAAALVWRAAAWRPRIRFSWRCLRDLTSFGVFSVATRLVWLSGGRIFALLVGGFMGVAAVGYLNIAQRIIDTLFDIMAGAAHNLALPLLSQRQHDRPAFVRAYLQAAEYTAFVTQPAFAGLAVCAPALVVALLGASWQPSVAVVQVLAVGAMVQFLLLFGPAASTAIGRPGLVFGISLLSIGGATAVLVAVRPDHLVEAAAIWAARVLIGGTLLHLALSRLLGMPAIRLFRTVAVPTAGAAMMAAALIALDRAWLAAMPPAVVLSILVGAGVAVYGGMTWLAARKSLTDMLAFVLAARGGKARPSGSD